MNLTEEPYDVADRFVTATQQGDEKTARACVGAEAWEAAGYSVGRFFQRVVSRSLPIESDIAERSGDRATAHVLVHRAHQPPQPVILLLQQDDHWSIEAIASGDLHDSLFLSGKVEARPVPQVVPVEPILALISDQNEAGHLLLLRWESKKNAGGSWRAVAAREVLGSGRAEIEVEEAFVGEEPEKVWVYIDIKTGWVVKESSWPTLSGFFEPVKADR